MGKKNAKPKILIGALVAVILFVIIINPDLDNLFTSEGEGFQFQFQTLAFTSPNITCFVKSTALQQFSDGSTRAVSQSQFIGGSSGTAPTLSLVNRVTGETIQNFIVELKGRCDDRFNSNPPLSGFTLLPSQVSLFVTAFDKDGSQKQFSPISKTTNRVTLVENQESLWARWVFSADQVESQLSAHTEPYRSQLIFNVLGNFQFQHVATTGTSESIWKIQAVQGNIVNSFLYQVEKIITPTPAPNKANSLIVIEKVTQTSTGKDLTSGSTKIDTSVLSGRQIRVESTVRDWAISEGNPTITIRTPSGTNQKILMSLDQRINSNADAIFVLLYVVPRDSLEGQYRLTMTLDGRTNPSVRSFWVDNADTIPTGTNGGGGTTPAPTPISMETETLKQGTAKIRIAYVHQYKPRAVDGRTTTDTVQGLTESPSIVNTILTPLPLDLTNNIKVDNACAPQQENCSDIVTRPIDTIKLFPQLFFNSKEDADKFPRAFSSDITAKRFIVFNGKSVDLPDRNAIGFSSQIRPCDQTLFDRNGCPLSLGEILTRASEIEQVARNNNIQPNSVIQYNVILDGKFVIQDSNNNKYEGSTRGATYIWNLNFGTPDGTDPSTPIDEEKNDCKTSDPDVICECPNDDDILIFDLGLNKVVCEGPDGIITEPEEKPECQTNEFNALEALTCEIVNPDPPPEVCEAAGVSTASCGELPYCETDSNGFVTVIHGEVTINSFGCSELGREPKEVKEEMAGGNGDDELKGTEDPPKGEPGVIDSFCQVFPTVCANAFGEAPVIDPEDPDTLLFVLVAVGSIIVIALVLGLRKSQGVSIRG